MHNSFSGDVLFRPSTNGVVSCIRSKSPLTLNETRQQSFLHRGLIVTVLLVVTFFSFPFRTTAATLDASTIISATNDARANVHLQSLSTNTQLTQAAAAKAADIFTKQYFNHVAPDGVQPWKFITSAGYHFTTAGENLAINYVDSTDAVQAWLQSSEHRKNILNEKFSDIGVAVLSGTLGGESTTVIVQFFGNTTIAATSHNASLPTAPTPKPQPVVSILSVATVPVTTAMPTPPPALPATGLSTLPIPTDRFVSPDFVSQPMPERIVFLGQKVEGVSTKVIPSLQSSSALASIDPKIGLLILAVFSAYMAMLLGLLFYRHTLRKNGYMVQKQPAYT